MEILFFIGMILGQHCGYTIRVEMRGAAPIAQTSIQKIITTMTFPAWISMFIWGFLNLKWYILFIRNFDTPIKRFILSYLLKNYGTNHRNNT